MNSDLSTPVQPTLLRCVILLSRAEKLPDRVCIISGLSFKLFEKAPSAWLSLYHTVFIHRFQYNRWEHLHSLKAFHQRYGVLARNFRMSGKLKFTSLYEARRKARLQRICVPRSLRLSAARMSSDRIDRFLKEARDAWITSRRSPEGTPSPPTSPITTSRLQERGCFYLTKTIYGFLSVLSVSIHFSELSPSREGALVVPGITPSLYRVVRQKACLSSRCLCARDNRVATEEEVSSREPYRFGHPDHLRQLFWFDRCWLNKQYGVDPDPLSEGGQDIPGLVSCTHGVSTAFCVADAHWGQCVCEYSFAGWYYLLCEKCRAGFMLASDLNGANGEWTGDDDMENHADRERARREAKNHTMSRPGQARPSVKAGAEQRVKYRKATGSSSSDDSSAQVAVLPPPEVKPTKILSYVYCRSLQSEYIFDTRMQSGMNYRKINSGDTCIAPGTALANVVERKFGEYVVAVWSDDRVVGESVCVDPCIRRRISQGNWGYDRQFITSDAFTALIAAKMPSYDPNSERHSNAGAALVTANGGHDTEVVAILMDSLLFYGSSRLEIKALALSRRFLLPALDVLTTDRTLNSLGIQVLYGCAWEEVGVNLAVPPFVCRPDVAVTCYGGATFTDRLFNFPTLESENPKWISKRFFQLVGRQQVIYPENNGHNLLGGLGRLFGEDTHAPFLRYQQEKLACMFGGTVDRPSPLLSGLGYDTSHDSFGLALVGRLGTFRGHRYLLHLPDGYSCSTRDHPDGMLVERSRVDGQNVDVEHDICAYLGTFDFTLHEYLHLQPVWSLEIKRFVKEMRDRLNPCYLLTNKYARRKMDTVKHNVQRVGEVTVQTFMEGWHWLLGAQHSREVFCEISHDKKVERVGYCNDFPINRAIPVDRCRVKTKNEVCKFGKRARIVATFKDGCVVAPHLAAVTKNAGGYYYFDHGGWNLVFKLVTYPSATTISECFDDLARLSGTRTIYVCACGDDLIAMYIWLDKWVQLEMDISSCDTNQRVGTWMVGAEIAQDWTDCIAELLGMAMLPLEVRNPSNKNEKFSVKPLTPIMSSGHAWTTFNNGNASGMISMGLLVLMSLYGSEKKLESIVSMAAFLIGHRLSVVSLDYPEQKMFLKYHPVLCHHPDGRQEEKYMLACGTYCRGFGVADAQFGADSIGVTVREFQAMSHKEIADRYESVVFSGLCHQPHNPVLDAFRSRFSVLPTFVGGVAPSEFTRLSLKHVKYAHEDLSEWTVDAAGFQRMYGFGPTDVDELVQAILNLEIGMKVTSVAIECILKVDYSVEFDEAWFTSV